MNNKKYIIGFVIALIGLIFLIRLFYIQVFNDSYKLDSRNNVLRYITDYPARGLFYDRNGELLVYNQAAYNLMVIPRQTETFDTSQFLELIHLDKKSFIERINITKSIIAPIVTCRP